MHVKLSPSNQNEDQLMHEPIENRSWSKAEHNIQLICFSLSVISLLVTRRKNAFEMGAYFKEGYTNLVDRMGLHSRTGVSS